LDINAQYKENGCNSFWLASYNDSGECLNLLANAGIDIFSYHNKTGNNALHVAI